MPARPKGWAREGLARALTRASDPLESSIEPVSTARLSELASDLERRLRAGAAARDPEGKGGVAGALHRVLRPLVRRYERTAIELAAIQTALAQRLERAEQEIGRLSQALEALQSGRAHSVEDDEPER